MKSRPAIDPATLRRAAEARLKTRAAKPARLQDEADLRRAQQELEIHQIELELQNEELQAALEEATAAQERYTDHFNFAPVGYFNLTADGTIKVVNLKGASLLGLARTRLLNQRFGQFMAETDRRVFVNFLARVFTTGASQACELALRRAGQPPQPCLLEATRSPDGQECRCVLIDITERKLAEEALRDNMARLMRQELGLTALSKKELLPDGDLLTALRRITEVSAQTLGVERVSVWRYTEDRSKVRCLDLYELHENRHSTDQELAVADYPNYFQMLAERDVIAADDACADLQTCEFADGYLKPLGITSKMAAPVQVKSVLNGMVCHEHVGPPRHWTADERTFAIAVGNSASLALEEWERKQAEKAFRQSQQAYAALVNTVDGIVWEADAQTFRFLFVSQMAERLLGYPTENWLNDPNFWRDHLHPEDREWAVNYCVEATRRKEDHDFRYRMIASDGRVVWLHDLVNVVVQSDRPVKLRGIMMDITENKLAEEELRWKTALFEAQMDSSIDGILVVDGQRKKVFQNRRLSEVWKIPPHIVEDKDDAVQFKFATSRTKKPKQFTEKVDYLYAHPDEVSQDEIELIDGTILDRYSSPVRDTAGKYYGRIWAFRDITERKLAECEIQRQAAFAHFNPNPVLELSALGEIMYFNDAARQMAHTLGQEHPAQILPPNVAAIVRDCLTTTQPLLRLETHAGKRTLSWSFFPVALGPVVHCYAGDITERKLIEEQLRQSQKMEAIGQLAGGVAHDFNNILAVIQMQADLTKAEDGISRSQLEAVNEIINAAERAANLTRQLLLFSRKQALQLRDLDLNEAVTNIAKMLQRVLSEDIQMQFKFHPRRLLIHADAVMMDQILLNLTVNARDAMPKGGRLVIETAAVEFDPATAAQTAQARPGSFTCLHVTDTGCGISPEIFPRIFEPFFTTKEVGKGTGLGLATVFSIVQQHHGWINVHSKVGQGTAFQIFLPRLTHAVKAKTAWSALAAVAGGNEAILLVEDDSSLRAVIRISLSRLGYRVLEAATGVEALAVWKQHRDEIRLLLTDLVMPGELTGIELAQRLLLEKPKLRVIYASGYSAEIADKDFSLTEGVNFLPKPFEARKLVQTVRNCLDSSPPAT